MLLCKYCTCHLPTCAAHNPILHHGKVYHQVNRQRFCVLEPAYLHVCGFGWNGNPELYTEKKLVLYCQRSHQHLSVSSPLIFGCFDGIWGFGECGGRLKWLAVLTQHSPWPCVHLFLFLCTQRPRTILRICQHIFLSTHHFCTHVHTPSEVLVHKPWSSTHSALEHTCGLPYN